MTEVRVRFVASVSPIVRDAEAARRFYAGALGVSFEGGQGDYVFTERLDGVKHLGLWPLADAAQACFGTTSWPADVPTPQASIEFEVDDVAAASEELQNLGYRLLHGPRTEPWTQVTARLLTPEGLLIAVCRTPWLHPDMQESPVREAFWLATDLADDVLRSPLLAARWEQPSALERMPVGDLAVHLVRATTVSSYLAEPAPTAEPISPADYFDVVLGDPTDLDSEQNRAVRERAHEDADRGADDLLNRWQRARSALRDRLAQEPPDRPISVAHGLVLTIDDYLVTRIVELLLHSDDLAVSLGIEPAPPPAAAAELAEHVLLAIARRRHGDAAVLRAQARRERGSVEPLRVL